MRTIIVTDTWPRAQVVAEECGIRKGKIWWVHHRAQILGVPLHTPVIIDRHHTQSIPDWNDLRNTLFRFLNVTNHTSPRKPAP